MRQLPVRDTTAIATGMLAIFAYGITPVFLRYFTEYLDFWTVNGLRYGVGALFWLPFVVAQRGRVHPGGAGGSGRIVWKDALIPSAVNLAVQVGWGLSPYLIPAPIMGFVYRLSFLFTVLLGFWFVRDERPLAREKAFLVGAAVCIPGLGLMFWERMRGEAVASLAALMLVLVTNFMLGSYAVAVRRCMTGYSARLSFGVISLYTAVPLVALMIAFGDTSPLASLPARIWTLIIVSALIGIAFAHVLYYRTIRGLGAIVSSGLLLAAPFITALIANVALGESMTPMQLAGGLTLVYGGAMLVVARARMEQRRFRRSGG